MSKRIWLICGVALLAALLIFVYLIWEGVILLNNPSRSDYPVRGIDVSKYQGEIDWQSIAGQGIDFAFIKATEGSSHVDPCFAKNFSNAAKVGLRIGAYHFFSFDSEGETQADNFIANVEALDGMLPPVVDVELYGAHKSNSPDAEDVREQLNIILARLENCYGVKPILYATSESYDRYIAYHNQEYDIWIRDVISTPRLPDVRPWTFWQYTDRERLSGYSGEEKFIDMNVFRGSREDFARYPN